MLIRCLRRCLPLLGVASLAAALLYFWGSSRATTALSYGGYQSNIPNGDYLFSSPAKFAGSNTCLLCHGWNSSTPSQILPSSTAGYLTAALRPFSPGSGWGGHASAALADTDGDGFTNGEELQDPSGAWTPASAPQTSVTRLSCRIRTGTRTTRPHPSLALSAAWPAIRRSRAKWP